MKAENGPAILYGQPEGRRVSVVLMSCDGFELKNARNCDISEICDAEPILAEFECNAHHESFQGEGAKKIALAVALYKASTMVLDMCPINRRIFPWDIFVPDLMMRHPFIENLDATPVDVFCEAYSIFSRWCLERDAPGFIREVSHSDDFLTHPSRYRNRPTTSRADLARRTQSILRENTRATRGQPLQFAEPVDDEEVQF